MRLKIGDAIVVSCACLVLLARLVLLAPSDHNVIHAGTGEAAIRGDISYGDGVYKSIDGGRHWKNVGLNDSRHIGALIVHPRNPDIVFVAALGHALKCLSISQPR
jgi:hypothetical protein